MGETSIALDPKTTPGNIHAKGLTPESAAAAAHALQVNRENNHIFTSDPALIVRLHNHVVYIVLCLWSLGATPEQINAHAERNNACAIPPPKAADNATVARLSDPTELAKTVGNEECYQDLTVFFEYEIARLGVDEVLQKYLLGDSEFAKDVYPRLYHGYVHSIMHLGIGLEFKLDSIIAEGIAEAVVHDEPWYTAYHAACRESFSATAPSDHLTLLETYELCLKDETVKNCVDWELAQQFTAPDESWHKLYQQLMAAGLQPPTEEPWRDRAWGRAGKNLAAISGRWGVSPDEDLERAAAEVINTSLYVVCGAMLPPHEFRVDFFLLHVGNCSYWLKSFLDRESITRAQKARLIEDTGRMLTFMAAGVGMPVLHPEVLEQHIMKTNSGKGMDWEGIFKRVTSHSDDGHMIKLVRALAHGEEVTKKYEGQKGFPMRSELFLKAANACMDNASPTPMLFLRHFDLIRGVGMEQAWAEVPLQVKVEA